ncbi:hypothetical protein ILYODFUR_026714 [Ilyodon furcidens]|uniref:Uncharacterized protein n=1 Tax=Ilyodon furcidens TaxID=33524 RepID=A0ABV0T335_9TELE
MEDRSITAFFTVISLNTAFNDGKDINTIFTAVSLADQMTETSITQSVPSNSSLSADERDAWCLPCGIFSQRKAPYYADHISSVLKASITQSNLVKYMHRNYKIDEKGHALATLLGTPVLKRQICTATILRYKLGLYTDILVQDVPLI